MGKNMGLIIMIIVGIIMLILGVKEVRRNSIGENVLGVIFDSFFGGFFSSGVGIVVIGLAFIAIGILGLTG